MCVRQRDCSDCGAACIASVCAFYGLQVSVARTRQYASTGPHGTTVLGMTEAAAKLGMTAKAVKAPLHLLSSLRLPAIAHIQVPRQAGAGHYVVLVRVNSRQVIIMDPAVGRFRKLSQNDFTKSWTGVAVLIAPGEGFRPARRKNTGRRLMELALPERRMLLLSVVAAVFVSILGLGTSLYLQQLIDIVLAGNHTSLLDLFSLLMIGLLLIQLLCGFSRDILTLQCSRRIDSRLVLGYYDHLLNLPQPFFDKMQVGEIMSRVNDAVRISTFINETAIGIVLNVLTLIFSLVVMLIQCWELALLVLAALPVYLLLFLISDNLNRVWQRKLMVAGAAFDAQLAESLAAAGTLKKLGLEEDAHNRTADKLKAVLDTGYRFSSYQVRVQHGADLTTKLLTVFLLWVGCYFVIDEQLSRGELFAFFALTGYLTTPLLQLLGAGKQVRDTQIAADRLFEVMELDKEQSGDATATATTGADIVFHRVMFRYGYREPVLQRIDLCIPKGSFIGITGESGTGKSTFAALLQKIYLPTEGNITVNGTDILHIDNRSLRSLVAAVPQHTDLFSGTIAENIAIGTAGVDEDRILEICGRLGITDFVGKLPAGFGTILNGTGHGLSGGERQRLAIARALYRQPAVLILDEATSALDTAAEKEVMQTLEWYNKKGITIIVIAHQASALANCRKVFIVENGFLK